jgi:dinuclear metal center YbgI/SA1388 family protein
MKLKELDDYLGTFLAVNRFDDAALNGLQVEGRPDVRRLALAVSACAEVFRKAAAAGADALVVHHGLLWKGDWPKPVTGVMGERLKILLDAECSLFAFHLPLDAHAEVGNNAVAARALGLQDLEPFCDYHGQLIGWRGRYASPLHAGDFMARLERYYGRPAHWVSGGGTNISRVGIVSGGAAKEAEQAAALGLDAYVTGEPGEPTTFLAREAGFHFFALGHHATERVGVRALGEHLKTTLGLDTLFIEVENEA